MMNKVSTWPNQGFYMHQTNSRKKQEETGRGAAYLDGGDSRGGKEEGRPWRRGQGLDGVVI